MSGQSELGLTLQGFKQFILNEISGRYNSYDFMYVWLQNLGYDIEINQLRSRAFNLTVHSEEPLRMSMRDALLTDLDFHTTQLIVEQYGQVQKEHQFYKVLYAFSEQVLAYSYAVQNLTNIALEITLDLSKSVSMVTSSKH